MALLSLLTFSSCSSDDDDTPSYNGATTEVCVLFTPDELGDQGYADRVLSGLEQFGIAQKAAGDSTVAIHFESPVDSAAMSLYLRQWADKGRNPFTGEAYKRRLLVLTTAYQAQLLSETPLGNSDEVLVINVHPDLFVNAKKSVVSAQGMYLLNISVAAATRHLCEYIDRRAAEDPLASGKDIWMLRRDTSYPQGDSISEVIAEHYGSAADVYPLSLRDMKATAYTTIATAYLAAGMLYNVGIHYALCDWGAANDGIAYYLYIQGGSTMTVFLDTSPNNGNNYSIIRYFDKALLDWLTRWHHAAAGTMPERETHGEWDGYASDNIPEY